MRRDRIAEDIYTFSSDVYAQVTSGVILTTEGTIVIDTAGRKLYYVLSSSQAYRYPVAVGANPSGFVLGTAHSF